MDKKEYIALYDDPLMYDQWNIGPDHVRSKFMLENAVGNSAIELGCGGSGFLRLLVERGFTCEGVDINPHWVEIGRQRLPTVTYTHSMVEDFQSSKQYDTVILMEILEHVLNPVTVLQKAESLLNGIGRVLVTVPLKGGPWDHTDNHLRQYDAEMLQDHAMYAGFSPISSIWEEGQYVYAVLV